MIILGKSWFYFKNMIMIMEQKHRVYICRECGQPQLLNPLLPSEGKTPSKDDCLKIVYGIVHDLF